MICDTIQRAKTCSVSSGKLVCIVGDACKLVWKAQAECLADSDFLELKPRLLHPEGGERSIPFLLGRFFPVED